LISKIKPYIHCSYAKKRIDNTDSIPQIVSEQSDAASHEDDAYDLINQHIESQRKKEPPKPVVPPVNNKDEDGNTTVPPIVIPAPKRTVTISHADIIGTDATFIETEDQVTQYINKLRDKLLNAVRDGDRVRIK